MIGIVMTNFVDVNIVNAYLPEYVSLSVFTYTSKQNLLYT